MRGRVPVPDRAATSAELVTALGLRDISSCRFKVKSQ